MELTRLNEENALLLQDQAAAWLASNPELLEPSEITEEDDKAELKPDTPIEAQKPMHQEVSKGQSSVREEEQSLPAQDSQENS
jgi:hypothetical protein